MSRAGQPSPFPHRSPYEVSQSLKPDQLVHVPPEDFGCETVWHLRRLFAQASDETVSLVAFDRTQAHNGYCGGIVGQVGVLADDRTEVCGVETVALSEKLAIEEQRKVLVKLLLMLQAIRCQRSWHNVYAFICKDDDDTELYRGAFGDAAFKVAFEDDQGYSVVWPPSRRNGRR